MTTGSTYLDINNTSDVVTDATETAVFRIADLLRHPDDLTNKLSSIRKRFNLERASIDAQLKTAVESQLDDAQRGLDNLAFTYAENEKVRGNLKSIDERCTAAQNTIRNYARIKKISRTHQNFVSTKAMVEQFQQLNSQVARIRSLLADDEERLLGPAPNLLLVHFKLQGLETFRNTTLAKARRSPPDVLNTLHDYFHKVDQLEQDFENHLFKVARQTVDLIKTGHASTVVRIVKIIETEERADELASIQEAPAFATSPTSSADEVSSYDASRPRPIKSYRIKFFDALRDSIVEEIGQMYVKNRDNLPEVLAQFDTIVDNLILVHDELVPRFPKRYNIFHFYVLEYHRAIYDVVNQITAAAEIEPGFILQLLTWVGDYYASMSSRLDVSEELLEPRLLDGQEEQLTGEYVKLVRTKLAEWLSNILQTETVDFLQRRTAPETDGSDNYLLAGSVIVFQMFNQQIDLVSSSSRGELLYNVVKECCRMLDEFHKAWTRIMDAEYAKFLDPAPSKSHHTSSEIAEGLPEYLVALANDCLRSSEFSEQLLQRIEQLIDASFQPLLEEQIKAAADGFMKLSRRASQILVDIILIDLRPAFSLLHTHPQWYDQDIMRFVVGTLEDYCEDFAAVMAEYLFTRFTTELMDRVVGAYIESFRNKTVKFRMPAAPDKIRSDLAQLTTFFNLYKTAKRVTAAFEPIEKIVAFVESNPRMAFLDFYSMWRAYPDCPLEFFEWLLGRRDDLDKATVKEVMEACRNKVQEEGRDLSGVQPTVFGRVKLK
ncbi:exocyst complex component Sec6-domain-containing protein [Fimicolochytrium jonesii]|uniref:exocyst complex component Sec6-domain-containing protein n=1 Tax=Fimicolochytrium jonesii TaxID=1396493 RepID=UPI0022FEF824|nr:exocyst complex component Sec6-domain-containing protein [Fimicolochytrium jonesii]KAI8816506.1 exocyst complex component Sec6-domain-containing protein [Fimicolochytrium jonesii]